jgi:hypothetical protein
MITEGYLVRHYQGRRGGRGPAIIDIAQDHLLYRLAESGIFDLGVREARLAAGDTDVVSIMQDCVPGLRRPRCTSDRPEPALRQPDCPPARIQSRWCEKPLLEWESAVVRVWAFAHKNAHTTPDLWTFPNECPRISGSTWKGSEAIRAGQHQYMGD